jgi:2-phosphoxylose phosphatase
VYRLGNWEYSQIYRDSSLSLGASALTYGVWIAELAAHFREIVTGKGGGVVWYHNVAHDGSVSRLLSILQIDQMVWPGMGSEVVFELYKKKTAPPGRQPTTSVIAPGCSHDNCLRQMIRQSSSASSFCPGFMPSATSWSGPLPTWASNCGGDAAAVASACKCLVTPTPTVTSAPISVPTSTSGYYVRVLFGGRVLKSSSPTLGLMDMLPVETLLAYFDGLVGVGASLVKGKCTGSIPVR